MWIQTTHATNDAASSVRHRQQAPTSPPRSELTKVVRSTTVVRLAPLLAITTHRLR
jgi:hypothetical protein